MGIAFLYGAGGGKPRNVLCIMNGDTDAIITATKGARKLTAKTDASGYAFIENLDPGTWTIQATKTGRYAGPKTVTIASTQTVYYIEYPFRTYLYDNSYQSAGANGANVCKGISGGWTIYNTAVFDENYMAASVVPGYAAYIFNNTPISLTPFTKLYVRCYCPQASVSEPVKVGICKTASTGADWRKYSNVTTTSTQTVEVDVSSLNNVSGCIRLVGAANHSIRVYKAWFE